MKLNTYVNYSGNCAAAFKFYEQHLGGKITTMVTHAENPGKSMVPVDWDKAVLHTRLDIGGTELFGADIPDAKPMRSVYLALTATSTKEAERIYSLLSEGGEIFMPIAETFFAHRSAMLRDRFGTSWMILHSKSESA